MKWPDLRRLDGYLPPDLEKAYRLAYLRTDTTVAVVSTVFFCVLLVAFGYNDYLLFRARPIFDYLIGLRLVSLALFVALIIFLRRNRSPGRLDWSIFAGMVIGFFVVGAINLTRPANFLGNFAVDVVIILMLYFGLPVRLVFRAGGALLFSLGEIVVLAFFRDPLAGASVYTLIVVLLMANGIGLSASSRIYAFRRAEFLARRQEERASMEIRKEAQQWGATFDAISDLVSIQDNDYKLVRVNKAYAEAFKSTPDQLIGRTCYDVVHGTSCPMDNCPMTRSQKTLTSVTEEVFEPRLGIYLEISCSPILDQAGHTTGAVHIAKDITGRRRAEDEIKREADEIQDLYDKAPAGYHSLNKDGVYVRINDIELSWLGYSRDEIIGKKKLADFLAPESRKAYEQSLPLMQSHEGPGFVKNLEYDLVRRDGSTMTVLANATALKDEHGNYVMSRTTLIDVTELRRLQKQVEETERQHRAMLEEMAMHDSLTGLANRSLLYSMFRVAQAQAQRNNRKMAVLEMDLDHFKVINDSMGHAAGDELLRATAARLRSIVRQSDTVARLGGDEFVILLPEIARGEDAALTAMKILSAFNHSFTVDGATLEVSTSIGVAVYPEQGRAIEELLKAADEAMYYVKEHGRKGYRIADGKEQNEDRPRQP